VEDQTNGFSKTETGYRVRLWFVKLWDELPPTHSFSEMERRYIPNVRSSMLASRFFISPDLDLSDVLPLRETIPGFQVFLGHASTPCGMLDKARDIVISESDDGKPFLT